MLTPVTRQTRRQTHPVAHQPGTTEDLSSFFDAQDGWELLLAWRPDELEQGPLPAQRPLDEELDPDQDDGWAMVVVGSAYFLTFFM